MAQDNLSQHLNIPVLHPDSGEVHNIAVPENTNIADFHSALSDYYHVANPEPTAAGAIENQEYFRAPARDAIAATGYGGGGPARGNSSKEHGFIIPKDMMGYEPVPAGGAHELELPANFSKDFATFHVHPNFPQPSANDVEQSKKAGIPFYVASREGLFMVRPSDGKVIQVFDRADWAKKKSK